MMIEEGGGGGTMTKQDSRITIEERGDGKSFVGQLPLNQQRRSTP